jgi:hypothetical protein
MRQTVRDQDFVPIRELGVHYSAKGVVLALQTPNPNNRRKLQYRSEFLGLVEPNRDRILTEEGHRRNE